VKREEKRSKKSVEMRNEMTQVTQRIISRGKSWPIPTKQILSFPSPDNTYREERLSRTKRGNRIIKGGGGSKKDVRKKGKKKRREIKREKKKGIIQQEERTINKKKSPWDHWGEPAAVFLQY
jgi:hypothetical protein